MLTAVQVRMARAALGWGVRDLAAKADVNANTVTRIENGCDATVGVLTRLKEALENAGIVFLDPGESKGDGFGVRLLPEIDGWLVNLEEGWARSSRALVTFSHDFDGTRSIGPMAPLGNDNFAEGEALDLGKQAMTAVSKALRQRAGMAMRGLADDERRMKLQTLRDAVEEGIRSGRAKGASIDRILAALDREA